MMPDPTSAAAGDDPILLLREGAVARLVLNRPARKNALSLSMWRRLPELLAQVADDGVTKVLVVTGAGGAFAAGADISEFEEAYATRDSTAAYSAAIAGAMDGLADFPKPTIAAIRGACIGGGLGLALACDLRFCAEGATLGITPGKLGLVYPLGDTRRLVQAVGPSRAKDLLYTGRLIAPAEALAMGLIDRLVPADGLDRAVADYAAQITAASQWSARATKWMIGRVLAGQVAETAETSALFLDAVESPDFQEGRRAFLEKRRPDFPVA